VNTLRFLSKGLSIGVALLLVAAIPITGCVETTAPASPTARSETTAPLTVEALKNAVYSGIFEEPVKLTDGQYEGPPFVEGGASRPTLTFTDVYTFGDLDGDGVEDAAVVLVASTGGSGDFYYLAAVLNRDGSPDNVATQLLGDRPRVDSAAINGAEITVDALTHGPDDPLCCPTQQTTLVYRYEGEQLMKVSEETPTSG
jgi:hypothetical protein